MKFSLLPVLTYALAAEAHGIFQVYQSILIHTTIQAFN